MSQTIEEVPVPNTLPMWLFYRFDGDATKSDGGSAWHLLSEENKLYWAHEADAVRRAVARGGFKVGEPS